jgi:dynein heavy chain
MIFEPADLAEASPATVSRCGMIYVEPSHLGWRALHASFCSVLKEKILPEQLELLEELIQWLVPAVLNFMMHPSCKLFIVTSDIHLYNVSNFKNSLFFSKTAIADKLQRHNFVHSFY